MSIICSARVLLMTYPVHAPYEPSTTSRHFGAETKNYTICKLRLLVHSWLPAQHAEIFNVVPLQYMPWLQPYHSNADYHNIIAVSRVPVPVPENFKLGCRLPVPEGKMLGCRSTFEPCLGVRQLE